MDVQEHPHSSLSASKDRPLSVESRVFAQSVFAQE